MTEENQETPPATPATPEMYKVPTPTGEVEVDRTRLMELAGQGFGVDQRLAELKQRDEAMKSDEKMFEYAKRVASFQHGDPNYAEALREMTSQANRGGDGAALLQFLKRGAAPAAPEEPVSGDVPAPVVPASGGGDPVMQKQIDALKAQIKQRDDAEHATSIQDRISREVALHPDLAGGERERALHAQIIMAHMASDPSGRIGVKEAADLYRQDKRAAEAEHKQRELDQRSHNMRVADVSPTSGTPEVHRPEIDVPKHTRKQLRDGTMKKAIKEILDGATISNLNDGFGIPNRQ